MGTNINFIVYNSVTFLRKGFAVDSIEVSSFFEVEVDNPDSIDIRLRNMNGDVYVVSRGEDKHLELIDFLSDMESVLTEEDELLEDLILCLIAPVRSKHTGASPEFFILNIFFCIPCLFCIPFLYSLLFSYSLFVFPFCIFVFPFVFPLFYFSIPFLYFCIPFCVFVFPF